MYGHVITKFSRMGRLSHFLNQWCSAIRTFKFTLKTLTALRFNKTGYKIIFINSADTNTDAEFNFRSFDVLVTAVRIGRSV